MKGGGLEGGIGEVKEYPLSDTDIQHILGGEVRVVPYPELGHMKSIDECFDSKGRCILLYLTESPTAGHWTLLLNKKKGIEFFDPYGEPPGQILEELPPEKVEELGMGEPYLQKLLKASGRPVFWNSYGFQKDRANVNTCGRHCVVRALYGPYSLERYKKIIDKSGMTPDDFVSALTASMLGK